MTTSTIVILGTFLTSMVCGFGFIYAILKFCEARKIYDLPDTRKIHSKAVPRLGGVAFIPSMLIAFIIALLVIATEEHLISFNLWSIFFFISLTLIFLTGTIDDIIGLTPSWKFLVEIIVACLLPLSGLYINNLHGILGIHEIPYFAGFLLTILVVVFINNAINLIDGIDGLAACLSLLALSGFLYFFVRHDIFAYSILIAGLLGVLVSFLFFNLFGDAERKNKIFMGDSGSLSLGYILGFLCVKCSMDNPTILPCNDVDFIMAYSLLSVPLLDAVRVFFVRISHHVSPFKADNNHIHHKFMRLGFTQHQALAAILVIAIGYIALNSLLVNHASITIIILVDILLYAILNVFLNRHKLPQNPGNVS